MKKTLPLILTALLLSGCLTSLENVIGTISGPAPLTEAEVAGGLKEALERGASLAAETLSVEDGYYGDPLLRLLLPPEADIVLENIEKIPGGEKLLEDLIIRINRSAEEAASEALPIFRKAILEMTIVEAFEILGGDEDEATQYFRRKSYDSLVDLYEPKLNASLDSDIIGGVSANETWYTLQDLYNSLARSLVGKLGGLEVVEIDLSLYLTGNALDGIFLKVAEEEKAIRENPLKRVTELLEGFSDRSISKSIDFFSRFVIFYITLEHLFICSFLQMGKIMKTECCVNQENVDIVVEQLIAEDDIVDISEIFKLLGDPTRMRIVAALRIRELCVGDISALMEISMSGVSHQLRLLKKSRIVKTRREGKMVYYALDDEHIENLIDVALNHVKH